jgi:hypothetical protein
LAGKYWDAAYGEIELCYAGSSTAVNEEIKPSESCKELIDAAPVILPGAVDEDGENVPTFLVHWNGLWASHARFRHHDGNIFNITLFNSVVSFLSFLLLSPSSFVA